MREEIKKKVVLLGLKDVLIEGTLAKYISKKNVREILKNLVILEEQNSLKFFIISGVKREVLEKMLKQSLDASVFCYIKDQNLVCAEDRYILERENIDRERYYCNISKDPMFCDEFIKVQFVESLLKDGFHKEEIVYFGHDLLYDAFYLYRFCDIDCALIRQTLSFNNKKTDFVKGLIYVSLTWPEFKKVIYGKKTTISKEFLNSFVFSNLKTELFGSDVVKKFTINLQQKKSSDN